MPTLPQNYEPSKDIMYKWFGTRKKPLIFGAVELPGFFQTHAFSSDSIRVAFVLVLEIIGALAIMFEGGFSLLASIPIIFAIIVDIVLAIQLHSYIPKRVENKNQAKATDDPALAIKYETLSHSGKFGEFILKSLIILIGLTKGLGYMVLAGEFLSPVILLFFIFIIIAFLHINTTGYWVAEYNLRRSINKEIRENILSVGQKYQAKERTSTFKSEVPINLINAGVHSLTKTNNEGEYMLKTVGILTDNDLAAMVAHQPNVMLQTVVATACIKHQIQNILLSA
jgi:hypothetical protein